MYLRIVKIEKLQHENAIFKYVVHYFWSYVIFVLSTLNKQGECASKYRIYVMDFNGTLS